MVSPGDPILSRRALMLVAGAGLASRLTASDSDFWNRKPPADWTPDEIERLLHDSPWARQITPAYTSLPPRIDSRPWSENPPVGLPPGRKRKVTAKAPYRATIRWESAQPIQSALRTRLPSAFDGYHVIAILFPDNIAPDLGPRPVEDLQESAALVGTRAIDAHLVQVYRRVPDGFLIGFRKTATGGATQLRLTARIGLLALKAAFRTGDMLYHGQPAL